MSKLQTFLSALRSSSEMLSSTSERLAASTKTLGDSALAKDGLLASVVQFLAGSVSGLRLLLGLFGSTMVVTIVGYVALHLIVAFKTLDGDSLAVISRASDQLAIWLNVCFTSLFGTTLFGGVHSLVSARTESRTTRSIRKNAARKAKKQN